MPDHGDPLFSAWRLEWVAHQVPTDARHLFDGNILHPERRTLAYSDSTLFPASLAAPRLWGGVHPVVAYNVVALSVAGLWPPFSATRIAYAAALGVSFDASLGLHGFLYERLQGSARSRAGTG